MYYTVQYTKLTVVYIYYTPYAIVLNHVADLLTRFKALYTAPVALYFEDRCTPYHKLLFSGLDTALSCALLRGQSKLPKQELRSEEQCLTVWALVGRELLVYMAGFLVPMDRVQSKEEEDLELRVLSL